VDRETLTVAEVAALFGIHPNSVYRAAKNGDLRTVQAPVRRVLFARREVEQMLRLHRATTTDSPRSAPRAVMGQVAA
jgi:excisionase family DNA binding protein